MARSLWNGTIAFGLVSVPVKAYTAQAPKAVRFNMINSKTGNRVRQQRVDESTGLPVDYEDIVKGYELSPERYVTFTDQELEAVSPQKTKTVDLDRFVRLDEIDPMWVDKSYYLAPGTGGAKAYRLLAQTLRDSSRVGIGKIVLRTVERLVAISAGDDGVLRMITLLYEDEVVSPTVVDVSEADVSEREVTMAELLVQAMSADLDHSSYQDEHRARVLAMIERKAAGLGPEPEPERTKEPSAADLSAALEATLKQLAPTPTPAPAVPEAV